MNPWATIGILVTMAEPAQQQSIGVILDSITDGVFTVDAQWRITSFNLAAQRITGVSRDDAIGKRCCEVFRASICEGACVLKHTQADASLWPGLCCPSPAD